MAPSHYLTNAGIMLTGFGEIFIKIQTSVLTKIHLKMPSAKYCPICLGLNELKDPTRYHGTWSVDCSPWATIKVPHFNGHFFPWKFNITYVVNIVKTLWILMYSSPESNSDLSSDYHPRTCLDQSLLVIRQWAGILNIAGKSKSITHLIKILWTSINQSHGKLNPLSNWTK